MSHKPHRREGRKGGKKEHFQGEQNWSKPWMKLIKARVHGLTWSYLLVEGAQVSILPHTAEDLRGSLYHFGWVSAMTEKVNSPPSCSFGNCYVAILSTFSWTICVQASSTCHGFKSKRIIALLSREWFPLLKNCEFGDESKMTLSAMLMVPSVPLSWKMTLAGVISSALPLQQPPGEVRRGGSRFAFNQQNWQNGLLKIGFPIDFIPFRWKEVERRQWEDCNHSHHSLLNSILVKSSRSSGKQPEYQHC